MICTPYNVIDLTTLLSCIVLILSPNMSQYVSICLKMSQNVSKSSQNFSKWHFETFWDILSIFEHFEPFWAILSHFEQFWAILSRAILGNFEHFFKQFWAILSNFEQFWSSDFEYDFKQFWAILSNFEQFWADFVGRYFEQFWEDFCGQV